MFDNLKNKLFGKTENGESNPRSANNDPATEMVAEDTTALQVIKAKKSSKSHDDDSHGHHAHLVDEDESKAEITNPILLGIRSNIPIIASLVLAILSISFYIIITSQDKLSVFPYYRTRWFALGIILAGAGVTYLGAFWNNNFKSTIQSYVVLAHSFVLTMFSYAYLIRLNNTGIRFFDYNLNTSIVFIPVSLLIFFVNYSIFSAKKHAQLLTVAQVLFIILFSYSMISFINVDSTFARQFNQGWLSVIFNWPAWFWLIISSSVITFISARNIPHSNLQRRVIYLVAYYIMNLEVLLVVHLLNFSYWYETLLALISWNFVYTNIYSLMTKKNDIKYKPRLTISIIYHLILFLIVLYVG